MFSLFIMLFNYFICPEMQIKSLFVAILPTSSMICNKNLEVLTPVILQFWCHQCMIYFYQINRLIRHRNFCCLFHGVYPKKMWSVPWYNFTTKFMLYTRTPFTFGIGHSLLSVLRFLMVVPVWPWLGITAHHPSGQTVCYVGMSAFLRTRRVITHALLGQQLYGGIPPSSGHLGGPPPTWHTWTSGYEIFSGHDYGLSHSIHH